MKSTYIRDLRERFGIDPANMANIIGVSESALKRWEQGESRPPEPVLILLDLLDHVDGAWDHARGLIEPVKPRRERPGRPKRSESAQASRAAASAVAGAPAPGSYVMHNTRRGQEAGYVVGYTSVGHMLSSIYSARLRRWSTTPRRTMWAHLRAVARPPNIPPHPEDKS